jgi:exo-beta-1,3-glucanase (GH17 family)
MASRLLVIARPMSAPSPTLARLALLLLAAAVLALGLHLGLQGRPAALPPADGVRLPCVSYAPFHRPGHTPFDPALRITPEQIEADLTLLRGVSGCVRTYGLDHGLEAVPAVASKLGLRVWLGAWIGRDPAANAAQLQRALALTREHADVVQLLIVGNEVLLRRELPPDALAALLAQARRESAVPVAYADVWEFWQRHAAVLAPQVDVVAAHVLPYWEDEPVGIDAAADHVRRIAGQLRAAFAPLPVVIAETGWPAQGRQRGAAQPGAVQQTLLARQLLIEPPALGHARLPPFNWIEAFDQPWKRNLEGAMGGYWGVFDDQGQRRVGFSGPMRADAQWQQPLWAAAVGAGLAALLGLRRLGGMALPLAGAGIGALALLQWRELGLWSRSPGEWAFNGAVAAVALAFALRAAPRLAGCIGGAPACARPGAVEAWRAGRSRGFATLHLLLLFAAALIALQLLFDGRYRPLAWPVLAAPAVLLALLAMLGDRLQGGAREERLLACLVLLAAPALLWQEGLHNTQALAAAATWVALALPSLLPHRAAPGRTHTSAASSRAGAAEALE